MLEAVKLLAYDVLQQENLTDICYGTVTETEPLKIVLEQKLELTESFLVLSQNVTKHTINYSMRRKDSDENWVHYEMIVEKQLKKGTFDLNDYLAQLRQIKKMGSFSGTKICCN